MVPVSLVRRCSKWCNADGGVLRCHKRKIICTYTWANVGRDRDAIWKCDWQKNSIKTDSHKENEGGIREIMGQKLEYTKL
jgi:hypothetical protein